MVQCSQTGKQHNVKVKDLSRDDLEPLISEDLVVNKPLILQYKGKPWPVTFLRYKRKFKQWVGN